MVAGGKRVFRAQPPVLIHPPNRAPVGRRIADQTALKRNQLLQSQCEGTLPKMLTL
jgi:hypothetical protein